MEDFLEEVLENFLEDSVEETLKKKNPEEFDDTTFRRCSLKTFQRIHKCISG